MQQPIVSIPQTNDLAVMAMKFEWDIQTYEEPVIHVRNYVVFQISNNINVNQNKSEGIILENQRLNYQDMKKKLFSEICCSLLPVINVWIELISVEIKGHKTYQ
jgi:hypothetical protein